MHCVDLGESFQTHIFFPNFAPIQPRTSLVKFARSSRAGPNIAGRNSSAAAGPGRDAGREAGRERRRPGREARAGRGPRASRREVRAFACFTGILSFDSFHVITSSLTAITSSYLVKKVWFIMTLHVRHAQFGNNSCKCP